MERYVKEITEYKGTVIELQREKERSEKKNNELNEQIKYIKKSWESIKNLHILDRERHYKSFRESSYLLDNENLHSLTVRYDNADVYASKEFLKSLLLKQTENEVQQEKQLNAAKAKENEMTKEIELLYISLENERKEFDKTKTRLEEAEKLECQLITKIQLLQQSFEENRRVFDEKEKQMKGTIQQKDQEIRKVHRLLKEQQHTMGEIKRMSKISFMKVNKSNTIDDVETLKKELADVQAIQQRVEERRNFRPKKEIMERYGIKVDGKITEADSEDSSLRDTPPSTLNYNNSEESLSTHWEEHRKEKHQTRKKP
ncbi:cingulin-like protein 1 isoform X2 [Mytilus californianus]|uniref:cingulin-like protein 1 isoform X2 n=1 Tax=Mytilus californianus TaxID=6549 RepID=UPI00224799D8|nr:cingulin-like protein 1 isoform X2 [Mytilus californianus]